MKKIEVFIKTKEFIVMSCFVLFCSFSQSNQLTHKYLTAMD